jgi:glyoxylase-like metal-dependent hydrolase (beta-lactamase superfamily II)
MRSIVRCEYVEGHAPQHPVEPIDVRFQGIERVICCWRVGDVLVDPGPESSLPQLLAALGDERPRALLLTHIHLDHAGATGALVRRWPDLDVYVHERGAPHVIDSSKLLASAGRLYGEANMAKLWGEVLPVPAERVHVLAGGETLPFDGAGRFRVAYTPGHASHHVCFLHEDSGRAFVGDMAGVRIPPARLTLAPTPPPDIDVEAWDRSLDLIAAWRPASLGLTHFGAVDDVDEQLAATRDSLHELAALTRDGDAATVRAAVERRVSGAGDRALQDAYAAAVPAEHIYLGLERYWRKRAERAEHPTDVHSA